MSYITRKVGKETIHYKLTDSDMDTAYYSRIEPLGAKNSFLEYEYGKDAADMTPVIDRTVKEKVSKASTTGMDEIDDDVPYSEADANDVRSMSYEKAMALFATPEELKALGLPSEIKIKEGAKIDLEEYPPNKDFKDANDESICSL